MNYIYTVWCIWYTPYSVDKVYTNHILKTNRLLIIEDAVIVEYRLKYNNERSTYIDY